MTKSYKRGFTLIELLVVIAIIGLLAAVVLASLGSARGKGADAAVKSQLSAIRSTMELYASSNNGVYYGACVNSAVPALANAASSAGKGGAAIATLGGTAIGTWQNATCHDGTASSTPSNAWAADAPLNASTSVTPSMWCVDSTGAAKLETVVLPASAVVCS